MTQNYAITLSQRPKAEIVLNETFQTKINPLPSASDLKEGEIIVENLYLSLDPAMRAWLDDRPSYIPPVQLGHIMRGITLGRVLASKSSKIKEQELVLTWSGWVMFAILKETDVERISALPVTPSPIDYLSVVGPTGLTAYFGMLNIGEPRPGETVVVSGAAGATGSIAGQIATLHGARVVGIAGTPEKCHWLVHELGFAAALNYKDPNFEKLFQDATPDGMDVFFDNVGGKILDMALARAKDNARFVMCGAISQYNVADGHGLKNYLEIITRRIKMQGFIVFDYADKFPEARQAFSRWLQESKVKSRETIITGGLHVAQEALRDMYNGVNTGKLIVEIKKL